MCSNTPARLPPSTIQHLYECFSLHCDVEAQLVVFLILSCSEHFDDASDCCSHRGQPSMGVRY